MARQQTQTCEDFRQRLGALFRNELDIEWRGRVKGHLLSCEACALAFGEVIAEAQVQPPVAVRALYRPPKAVLEAMGVRDRHGSSMWTELRTLAARGVEWAQQECARVYEAFRETLQFVMLPQPRWADLGTPEMNVTPSPQYAEVELLDVSRQPCEGTIRCEILTPPTVTSDGAFLLAIRTVAPDLVDTTLRCTVDVGMRVTFETMLQRAQDGHGWEAVINAEGLPAGDEPMVIPIELVHLSLQME